MTTIRLKNGEHLTISKACVSDAKNIIRFLNKVGGETDFLSFGLNQFPFSLLDEKALIKECLSKGHTLMLVGFINQQIVSQLFLDRSHVPRLSHSGSLGITVSKRYWGQSIATHMLNEAMAWSKSNQITKLQLDVHADNHRAIALYTRLGFVIEGTMTRGMKINDVYFDNVLMGLEL